MALAPLPMTPTRLSDSSTPWSHRAEWNDGPANVPIPSMSGRWGRFSWPHPMIRVSASMASVPSGPVTSICQVPVASS